MSFYEVANHPLIYGMVVFGIFFVAGVALLSMRKSWRRAKEIGYTQAQLMTVVKSSVLVTIVPSIAIVVGFFALAGMLGIPWPWWRLSVIGSVTYETMAASMAFSAAGVELRSAAGTEFVLIMWVMTIGIMGGLIVAPFIAEMIHTGSMKMKDRDKRWGSLSSSVFMLAIIIAFVVPIIFDRNRVKSLTLLTSAAVCFTLSSIAKKFKLKWLNEFILVFTMIIAMASSVLWTAFLQRGL